MWMWLNVADMFGVNGANSATYRFRPSFIQASTVCSNQHSLQFTTVFLEMYLYVAQLQGHPVTSFGLHYKRMEQDTGCV